VFDVLTVVGFGLLGGSIAKAARAAGLVRRVVAVGRNAERLAPARADGTADHVTIDLAEGVSEADLVVLATPVETLLAQLPEVWRKAPARAVITDVGSTKAAIVRAAESLAAERPLAFVGSHPMAGSEKSGYAVSRVDLYRGATVIVTPTAKTEAGAAGKVTAFWQALGARVKTLPPEEHDEVVALISHLPHLVAFALVDAVGRVNARAVDFAAGGFRDTTRVAAADPQMWREIFLTNRPAMERVVAAFHGALNDLERLIEKGDAPALERVLGDIRARREAVR
jgi:prephenate dehydrogenase